MTAMGRFDPFAALSGSDRYVRGAAVHYVVFARIPRLRTARACAELALTTDCGLR